MMTRGGGRRKDSLARPRRGLARQPTPIEGSSAGHAKVNLPHEDELRACVGGRACRSLEGAQLGPPGRDCPVGGLDCPAVPPNSSDLTQQAGANLRRSAPYAVRPMQVDPHRPADSHRDGLAVGTGPYAHRAGARRARRACRGGGRAVICPAVICPRSVRSDRTAACAQEHQRAEEGRWGECAGNAHAGRGAERSLEPTSTRVARVRSRQSGRQRGSTDTPPGRSSASRAHSGMSQPPPRRAPARLARVGV